MELNVDVSVEQMEAVSAASESSMEEMRSAAASETPIEETASVQAETPAEETSPEQTSSPLFSDPPVEESSMTLFSAEKEGSRRSVPSTLQEVLDQHLVWLHSEGQAGRQGNLCRAVLAGVDLTDANLRDTVLHKAVLKGAELLLTDFQGASLLQADLQGANLLGAKFQDANLQGATLEDATGLQSEQLAGANLFGAALPAQVSVARDLRQLQGLARLNTWLIAAMAALSGLATLRIVTTVDAKLLANGPVVPLPSFQNVLPLVPFYLCGPAAMLGLYICLHLCLQRLWDSTAMQPAIFPDGRRLDDCLPWFARWPARSRMKWLR
jgi:hypothetical protein